MKKPYTKPEIRVLTSAEVTQVQNTELTEIARDENGYELWRRPYIFKDHPHPNKFVIVYDNIPYAVVSRAQVGSTVYLVVRRTR